MADITDPLDRKFLVQDLLKEKESDEESGVEESESDSEIDEGSEKWISMKIEERMKKDAENEPEWRKYMSNRPRKYGNNGPKGVLNDFKEAQEIKKRLQETEDLKKLEYMKRATLGITSTDPSISLSAFKQSMLSQNKVVKNADSDEEELAQLRERLKAVRMADTERLQKLPSFGSYETVSKFEFVDKVSTAHPSTFVVIHLSEDYILACNQLDDIISQICHKLPHVQFLKLNATEADPTLTHSALPALMVYRNDDLVNEVEVKLADTLIEHSGSVSRFSTDDFEWFLSTKYGIPIPGLNVQEEERDRTGLQSFAVKAEISKEIKRITEVTQDSETEDEDEDWT